MSMIDKKTFLRFTALASLSLGLAPFVPEPHIWGKLKWVLGGGVGMESKDYLDLLMHGTPWLLLIVAIIWQFIPAKKS